MKDFLRGKSSKGNQLFRIMAFVRASFQSDWNPKWRILVDFMNQTWKYVREKKKKKKKEGRDEENFQTHKSNSKWQATGK